jgi:hypothetical protein
LVASGTLHSGYLEEFQYVFFANASFGCFWLPGGEVDYDDVKFYQEVVGSLIYLSMGTRPDIMFAVGVVSRYMNHPKVRHWGMVKGILRYLRGTLSYGIAYGFEDVLVVFTDSDWGSDLETRRSTSGYVFSFGRPISWKSKYQATVALSTVEAEYMALSACVQECIWLLALSNEVGLMVSTPILIYQDNQGTISFARNPG